MGRVGRSWGWLLAFGVLTLLAGIAALVAPGPTIEIISIVFGVQLLIGGVFWFVRALSTRDGAVVHLLLAVLAVLAGVAVLRNPAEAALVFPLVLGMFWIVGGLIETFHSIAGHDVPGRGWAIASGALSVLAGIALLIYPGLGLVTMTYLLGFWLIVYGAIAATRALQARPHGAAASAPPPPHAGPAPA
ncbi:HdeD family acid-resistance protein [Saccharopolyspora rhizosphaerae]|uniref:HdeD family acid-resistance protein n=1 Tax=Saccharopolyspora rhizosphaerae TaxID=2492662 RepID=A0A3R8P3U4_9PSEU|nr:HdeD family acid-resistance protein [Saccharopolyspora rhizosphaerae]